MKRGLLIILSGPSGVGKGTIRGYFEKNEDLNLAYSTSMTTRKPREGEVDGVDYFFRTKEEFENAIEKGQLLEYAEFVGNYYGTPRAYVEEQMAAGKDVILEIEVQGAVQIKAKFPEAILIFVTPPSVAELERRLRGRGTETEEKIQGRLTRAKEEVEFIPDYDFILVNDELEECIKGAVNLIDAAKSEPERSGELMSSLRRDLGVG